MLSFLFNRKKNKVDVDLAAELNNVFSEIKKLYCYDEISDDRKYVLISDGRTRKLSGPKKKSIKHLKMTGTVIDINDITNKKLKMVLKNIDCSVNESEV